VSKVQEKQMTTVTDSNVFNIAIRGTFDDGQAIVKAIFNDLDFKEEQHLGAINSINWARVLAQVVYYVYACLHISSHENDKATDFSVPTGNFGDIFAGFIAKRMLPEGTIRKLMLATNSNDILSRMVSDGDYSLAEVVATSSPSMDIQSASNFERYLYYLLDKEPNRTNQAMAQFVKPEKSISLIFRIRSRELSSPKKQLKKMYQHASVNFTRNTDTSWIPIPRSGCTVL